MLRARQAFARLGAGERSQYLPLLLLLLALAAVFVFGGDRGRFYRPGHHDWLSAHIMTNAANLSPEHNFLLFNRLIPGKHRYEPYNRFPLGGYALVKLAILPFGDSLSAQLYAARMLMLLFFCAAAALAYLALARLSGSRWIALGATLLAFSSYYCLYYSDMVSNESAQELFGVLLVFHGMVIFEQEGRFRQLLVKTAIALLLGWHVYALLLPFITLGLAKGLWTAYGARLSARLWLGRAAGASPARSPLYRRYLLLGIFALVFGLFLLSANFANEYYTLNWDEELVEMPSFKSMLFRIGLNEEVNASYSQLLAWPGYLQAQFARIGGMSVPFSTPIFVDTLEVGYYKASNGLRFTFWGVGAFAACLAGLFFVRHKILVATLVLCGFCWSLPMRNHAFAHDFQALYYIGIPLIFFSLALLYIRWLSGGRLVAILVVAALPVFVLSASQMSRVGYDAGASEFHAEVMADFEVIRRQTEGRSVFVNQPRYGTDIAGAVYAPNYYLSGSVILYQGDNRNDAELIIMNEREPSTALLTPENRLIFLYDRAVYDRMYAKPMGKPLRLANGDNRLDYRSAWETGTADGE